MMIALRARREAFHVAANVAYPKLEVPRPPEVHIAREPEESSDSTCDASLKDNSHLRLEKVPQSIMWRADDKPAACFIGGVLVSFDRGE
jgi:hypothetical protein